MRSPAISEDPIPSMPEINFSVEGIQKLLSDLVTSKANGPDGVPSFVLKHCTDEISCVAILKVIFTRSLSTGVLSSNWQKANVHPIFKKGRRDQTSNYRPTSLTSIR